MIKMKTVIFTTMMVKMKMIATMIVNLKCISKGGFPETFSMCSLSLVSLSRYIQNCCHLQASYENIKRKNEYILREVFEAVSYTSS